MIIYVRIKVCVIDFTSWYFVLKHFKLQQFNIISFFLFFVQSDPMSDIGIKEIFKNKANIAQLSKKRKPLISRDFFFFLHQRCSLIGERT